MPTKINKKLEKATKLTEKWYRLIAGDHHKDRDCHFYIDTVFSYGDSPYYRLSHHGYIADKIQQRHTSYESALDALISFLETIIAYEENYNENNEL
jgi:hypothetical protein